MPEIDSTAAAALEETVQRPAFFAYLDLVGMPARVTTAGYDVTFAATGDPDLDGHTFLAINPRFVDIGAVTYSESGAGTVECTLSEIREFDQDLLDVLADRSKWKGRTARLWMLLRDETGAQIGAVVPYYTGYMSAPSFNPSPESQTITLSIEGYLAAITADASNRSYSGQASFDPGDQSAQATIAAANGVQTGPGSSVGAGGGSGGGGGRFRYDTVIP